MHNAIIQSQKVKQTLPTFQVYGPTRYKNVKQTLPYLGNTAQARSRKDKGFKERGNPNTCSREGAKRERERENHSGGARPLDLLNIALCRLASSCLHPCPFCLRLGGLALASNVLASCVYMQRQERQASRQEKKQMKVKAC